VSMMPCALVWGEASSKGNRKMLKINLFIIIFTGY
jgi:hypothetical protein